MLRPVNLFNILSVLLVIYIQIYVCHLTFFIADIEYFPNFNEPQLKERTAFLFSKAIFFLNPKYILLNFIALQSLFVPILICFFTYKYILTKSDRIIRTRKKILIYITLIISIYLLLATFNLIVVTDYRKVLFTFFQNYGSKFDSSRALISLYFIGQMIFVVILIFILDPFIQWVRKTLLTENS